MILYSLESLWNSLQEYTGFHLIWSSFGCRNIRIPSDHLVTHRNQLHGASYFDHYSQLQTPFSIILYYLESLRNFLQEYPGVHLIWSSFGRRNIWWPSDHPVTHRNQIHHVLIITFCSELRFWWSWTLWKAYEIIYKNIQKYISLDQVLGTNSMHQFNRCYYFMWNSTNSEFIWVLSLTLVLLGLYIHPWNLIWLTRYTLLVPWLYCQSITKITRNGLNGAMLVIVASESEHICAWWLLFPFYRDICC